MKEEDGGGRVCCGRLDVVVDAKVCDDCDDCGVVKEEAEEECAEEEEDFITIGKWRARMGLHPVHSLQSVVGYVLCGCWGWVGWM